jgi:hypothetical protein
VRSIWLTDKAHSLAQLIALLGDLHTKVGFPGENLGQSADLIGRTVQNYQRGRSEIAREPSEQVGNRLYASGGRSNRDDVPLTTSVFGQCCRHALSNILPCVSCSNGAMAGIQP